MKKSITAKQLMEKLSKDSAYLKMRKRKEEDRHLAERVYREEQRELLSELDKKGIYIDSVYDLVNTSSSYPKAIPVLIKHLNKPYSPAIKEGIIRALTVKEAKKEVLELFKEEYKKEKSPQVKGALYNALTWWKVKVENLKSE